MTMSRQKQPNTVRYSVNESNLPAAFKRSVKRSDLSDFIKACFQ